MSLRPAPTGAGAVQLRGAIVELHLAITRLERAYEQSPTPRVRRLIQRARRDATRAWCATAQDLCEIQAAK